jgi:uncharacterized membrane protein (GlpM family)
MNTLKKLWIALSIFALGAMALTPALAAAQSFQSSAPGFNSSAPSSQSSAPGMQNSAPNSQNNVGGLQNPLGKVTGICQLLKEVLNIAILIGVPIAMLFIVYAGLKLVMASGNPEKLRLARMNLMWTFIGIAIFLGVWFFVQLLATTLGSLGVQILGDCR